MTIKTLAAGGAAAIVLVSVVCVPPAMARTRHPATKDEVQQTEALNAQALANARMGTNGNAPSASTNMNSTTNSGATMSAPAAPNANAPATNSGSMDTTAPAPESTTPAPAPESPAPAPDTKPAPTNGQ
nr:hypothetical protein Hi04_10k_c4996_00002 [uncultured bacterium]